MIEKQKYFFCYLKTGGGHLAPARSVAKYLTATYGNSIEPVLVDGLEHAKPFARFVIEDGYRILQARAKWYFELIYALNKFPPVGLWNVALADFFIRSHLRKKIIEERPSKIVVFHFLLIKPVYSIIEELGLNIPVVTVVTDPFTAHPMWFKRKQKKFIVFSARLKEHCIKKLKIPKEKLEVFPFIIDEKFSLPLPQEERRATKEKFSFSPEKKLLLIMGGGDGIPHGKFILEHLLPISLNAEIAIVCGKNKQLYDEAIQFQQRFPSLKVFAFIDFVYELLNISDIVITKCGASTIMEILMLKKVPVINDFIWEQELGNMEFVRDNRLGIFERNIGKLPGITKQLIEDEEYYRRLQQNIERMNLKNGTKEVAEFLVSL